MSSANIYSKDKICKTCKLEIGLNGICYNCKSLIPFFNIHEFSCKKHEYKRNRSFEVICVKCGLVEKIGFFVVTYGDNN